MTNTLHRLTTASAAAAREFRRVYNDPGAVIVETAAEQRRQAYALLWQYYQNSAFEEIERWAAYRRRHLLYRHTRPIYNPAARLVDYYAGSVYDGDWPATPEALTDRTSAIPFAVTTPAALLAAVSQIFRASNWQQNNRQMVRHGAALGDAMIVIVDDTRRRRVYLDLVWPGHVADLQLDPAGNVTAYALEYDALDARGMTYTYRREVDRAEIATYKDGEPTGYDDQPERYPNPYGFTPAAWIRHNLSGSEHGRPAIRSIGKIDELNSLAAHAIDQAHRVLGAPILISGLKTSPISTKGPTTTSANAEQREDLKFITSPEPGATVETLQMDAGETINHIDHLLAEIERDHPELGFFDQMRGMTQITGPAADRLFGDVRVRLLEARASYDLQTIKALQMGIAIAGWRANRGDWGSTAGLPANRLVFLPFGLESYAAGDLDMAIRDRPLMPATEADEIDDERKRIALARERLQLQAEQASAGSVIAAAPQGGIAARIAAAVQAARQPTGASTPTAPSRPAEEAAAVDAGEASNPTPQPQQAAE